MFFLIFSLIILSQNICSQERILPGIYSTEEYFDDLENKKIALVMNHSSLIENKLLVDTLMKKNFNVIKIFTPEHGFKGNEDAGKLIKNSKYNENIIIISLYGNKKKPSKEDLYDVDIVVFDIQDVGVRFYTYISTLHYIMEACAENNKKLIILDRPNPNGFYIDGPILEYKYKSFVGMHPVPIVYGMTIGEYALMINGEEWLTNKIKCNLKIVKCKNYTHDSIYIPPVPPSPNLKNIHSILLYPTIGLFEGTIMSVGRGTTLPFEIIGHPNFYDRSFCFIPQPTTGATNPPYKGRKCYGIDLRNCDFYKEKKLNITLIIEVYHKMKQHNFFNEYFNLLAGTDKLKKQIMNGLNEEEIRKSWQNDIENFKKIREKYLLYK